MTTALATQERPAGGALAMLDAEQLSVIKDLICPGASDSELALFGQVCQRTGLDPFSKQIYGIMRWDGRKQREVLSIQTSIDGFRLSAQRSGDYAGQEGPQWCGEDGVWRDVWLAKEPPSAARVGVYRKGWARPAWGIATWTEYAQMTKDGKPSGLWRNMPANMLAKCAESQAIRKAFPAELSGLYSKDEMGQADNEDTGLPAQPIVEPHPAPVVATAWTKRRRQAWQAGQERAAAIGAAIPTVPDENASGDAVLDAITRLAANVKAREALIDGLRDGIRRVTDLGSSFEEPDDLFEMSDGDIAGLTEHVTAILEASAVPA